MPRTGCNTTATGLSDAQMEQMMGNEHGGYVYFTPARPRHYRNYSVPNEAMWCCVGTGMENHGKYGQFIYTHKGNAVIIGTELARKRRYQKENIR